MRLLNRMAVVTGAGRGIGKATAAAMVAEGATVILADRDLAAAENAAGELSPDAAFALPIDIGEPKSIAAFFDAVTSRFERIDILVNNAGVGVSRLFVDTSPEDLERIVRVNLIGTFLCCQHAARLMMRQRSGRIVNVTSLAGQKGVAGRAAYGASKAGVELLTKVMAVELADYGIRVNAIAPGPIMTDMAREIHSEETRETFRRLVPQRRYGEIEEVAAAAVFLASEESSFVTGHTLNVDGGFLAASLTMPLDEKAKPPIRSFEQQRKR